mmetsp:Transcript_97161/g.275245  ORF Transcript_97161/g.275245 Transcript_97161/m.275245 type:complete len:643 (-) Transcript_97161:68-1996(-)
MRCVAGMSTLSGGGIAPPGTVTEAPSPEAGQRPRSTEPRIVFPLAFGPVTSRGAPSSTLKLTPRARLRPPGATRSKSPTAMTGPAPQAAAPPAPGTASSSEALAQAARRQSVINEVQTRIDQLSQNLRGVTIPAGAAGAGRVNDIGGTVNSAIGMGLPRLTGTFPAEWLKHFTQEELLASALEAENWREGTKQAFLHAWKGYHAKAWGKDEVRPVSGGEGKKWANCGMQILDALSTMWVMGLTEQFDEATKWVEESLRFDNAGMVSFFELTIRALGGLVSAHSLSGREVFLRKARELADKMLPAFRDENPGFPFTQVNLKTGKGAPGWYSGTVLSEAGTVQLEFRYISQLTGDPKYAQKADRSMRGILEAANGRGLVPWGLSRSAPRTVNSHITFGAMGDSYYEYLLKMYLQTNQTESEWLVPWKKAMSEMTKRLLLTTKGGLLYLAEENNGKPVHKMDHLACFVGGMLKYAARVLPKEHVDDSWEGNAAALTETCYQMYHRQPTHLAPECSKFEPNGAEGQDMQIYHNAFHYLLRPEAAEAIFYMFYYTGDPKYRRMAGEIFEAIEKYARTTYGYSAVKDVRQASPQLKNEMETFFLAETLKYLYLTFVPNPQEVIDLDRFVLTTEAHPIRIFPPGSSPAR